MADFNSDWLGNNNSQGRYGDLPSSAAVSLFVNELKAGWRQINETNLTEQQKITALQRLERVQQEKFLKLSMTEQRKLYAEHSKNLKEQEKILEREKDTLEALRAAGEDTIELEERIRRQEEAINKNRLKSYKELRNELKQLQKGTDEYRAKMSEYNQAVAEQRSEGWQDYTKRQRDKFYSKYGVRTQDANGDDTSGLSRAIQLLDKATSSLSDAARNWFTRAETILNTYNAKISARLEGSGKQYKDLSKTIKDNLSVSTIVKQTTVLEKLASLVDSGVAYNLEQRAFLASVSENIAQTFDAFNSNLAQTIRLQREDSTYARLGLEASLQELFNSEFLDTSYLSDVRKSVTAALIEAEATMSNMAAVEFEYVVQKWLGSLYSVGASSNFVQQIAAGLNMLGTGNVSGLSGSPIQTILAMSANRSGLSYASLAQEGLTAQTTNELLRGMVEYLAEIAESTSTNRVVSGAYNTIFGTNQADLRALRNITESINSIYSTNRSYGNLNAQTTNSLLNIGNRLTFSAKVGNLMENLKYSAASDLVENDATYAIMTALNAITDITGGINLPFVSVLGTGVDLNTTLEGLIRGGMFGISFLSRALGSLGKIGGQESLNWITNSNPGEMRGTGRGLLSGASISQSGSIAGGSGADITEQTLSGASQSAKDTSKTINGTQNESDNIELQDIYYGLFKDKDRGGHLQAMSNSVIQTYEMLMRQNDSEKQAQRVVITGWNMGQDQFELPVRYGPIGTQQMNALSGAITNGNISAVDLIIELLTNMKAENGALNVNLATSDVDLKGFVMNTQNSSIDVVAPPSGSGMGRVPNVVSISAP